MNTKLEYTVDKTTIECEIVMHNGSLHLRFIHSRDGRTTETVNFIPVDFLSHYDYFMFNRALVR